MLVLPKEKSVPKVNNPKFLILAGRPKAGKSTIMASLDNNLIIDLENGYQALSALVEGQDIDTVISKLKGITCNFKQTSCGDQLAQALIKIKEQNND